MHQRHRKRAPHEGKEQRRAYPCGDRPFSQVAEEQGKCVEIEKIEQEDARLKAEEEAPQQGKRRRREHSAGAAEKITERKQQRRDKLHAGDKGQHILYDEQQRAHDGAGGEPARGQRALSPLQRSASK